MHSSDDRAIANARSVCERGMGIAIILICPKCVNDCCVCERGMEIVTILTCPKCVNDYSVCEKRCGNCYDLNMPKMC